VLLGIFLGRTVFAPDNGESISNPPNTPPITTPGQTPTVPTPNVPATPSTPSSIDQALIGRWDRDSGDIIYFFLSAGTIEFTDNGNNRFEVIEVNTPRTCHLAR